MEIQENYNMEDRPNPKDVNPYDSKAFKRTKRFLKSKKRKPPKNTNPYDLNNFRIR